MANLKTDKSDGGQRRKRLGISADSLAAPFVRAPATPLAQSVELRRSVANAFTSAVESSLIPNLDREGGEALFRRLAFGEAGPLANARAFMLEDPALRLAYQRMLQSYPDVSALATEGLSDGEKLQRLVDLGFFATPAGQQLYDEALVDDLKATSAAVLGGDEGVYDTVVLGALNEVGSAAVVSRTRAAPNEVILALDERKAPTPELPTGLARDLYTPGAFQPSEVGDPKVDGAAIQRAALANLRATRQPVLLGQAVTAIERGTAEGGFPRELRLTLEDGTQLYCSQLVTAAQAPRVQDLRGVEDARGGEAGRLEGVSAFEARLASGADPQRSLAGEKLVIADPSEAGRRLALKLVKLLEGGAAPDIVLLTGRGGAADSQGLLADDGSPEGVALASAVLRGAVRLVPGTLVSVEDGAEGSSVGAVVDSGLEDPEKLPADRLILPERAESTNLAALGPVFEGALDSTYVGIRDTELGTVAAQAIELNGVPVPIYAVGADAPYAQDLPEPEQTRRAERALEQPVFDAPPDAPRTALPAAVQQAEEVVGRGEYSGVRFTLSKQDGAVRSTAADGRGLSLLRRKLADALERLRLESRAGPERLVFKPNPEDGEDRYLLRCDVLRDPENLQLIDEILVDPALVQLMRDYSENENLVVTFRFETADGSEVTRGEELEQLFGNLVEKAEDELQDLDTRLDPESEEGELVAALRDFQGAPSEESVDGFNDYVTRKLDSMDMLDVDAAQARRQDLSGTIESLREALTAAEEALEPDAYDAGTALVAPTSVSVSFEDREDSE